MEEICSMSINSITPAQYRAAWQRTRNSGGTSSFGALLAAAAGLSNPLRLVAARAMVAASKKSYQLPNGLWTDGESYDASRFYTTDTPCVQQMKEYASWSATRPALSLPDSTGLTEANLAYLRSRYPGSMNENERMEALLALRDAGVISREQYNSAIGSQSHRVPLDETYNGKSQGYIGGASSPSHMQFGSLGMENEWWYRQWEDIHINSPFAKFKNLDDILDWAATLPDDTSM